MSKFYSPKVIEQLIHLELILIALLSETILILYIGLFKIIKPSIFTSIIPLTRRDYYANCFYIYFKILNDNKALGRLIFLLFALYLISYLFS